MRLRGLDGAKRSAASVHASIQNWARHLPRALHKKATPQIGAWRRHLKVHGRAHSIVAACFIAVLLQSPGEAGAAANDAVNGDWPTSAHDPQGTRYSPLDQVGTRNVGSLKLA